MAAPRDPPVNVTFFGGLGEIGRNMATIEVDGRIAVVDVGVFFPNPEHLGVDLIIPDWSGAPPSAAEDVEALFLTHGHLDHIGAIGYFLTDFPDVTIYGTKLTLAFVEAILEEWEDLEPRTWSRSCRATPSSTGVRPSRRSRSPTPSRTVSRSRSARRTGWSSTRATSRWTRPPSTGSSPTWRTSRGSATKGVDLLLADSTNADVPGHVPTERTVGRHEGGDREGRGPGGRDLVRVARPPHPAGARRGRGQTGRRPVFVGRSMLRNMGIASELGYLDYDETGGRPQGRPRYDRRS
jgi:ribonuclease J